ncbi:hypothetical protein MAPG_04991 [Magnaporthiopsis poae ATCC 64411]|uniref:Uncharacterized protein n=1 Tax=Magnaporthiopsis poae (strain ATCC 64411 / 73-15) TaxID=644358 RepID=A0A0C4DY80_MAGP6|nr:hypothetical protein MAPG_04991 [Magnaporthiopsis poae ATCC 64411]
MATRPPSPFISLSVPSSHPVGSWSAIATTNGNSTSPPVLREREEDAHAHTPVPPSIHSSPTHMWPAGRFVAVPQSRSPPMAFALDLAGFPLYLIALPPGRPASCRLPSRVDIAKKDGWLPVRRDNKTSPTSKFQDLLNGQLQDDAYSPCFTKGQAKGSRKETIAPSSQCICSHPCPMPPETASSGHCSFGGGVAEREMTQWKSLTQQQPAAHFPGPSCYYATPPRVHRMHTKLPAVPGGVAAAAAAAAAAARAELS